MYAGRVEEDSGGDGLHGRHKRYSPLQDLQQIHSGGLREELFKPVRGSLLQAHLHAESATAGPRE